jgi:histidinol-phosphatase (PHP family)
VLTDYHMHLQPDGVGARADAAERWDAVGGHLSSAWIGRYVERARSRAVAEIAITEHVHRFAQAREWFDNPWWREEATEDVDAYCEAILAARAEGLPVLVGVEMDWLPGRTTQIAEFLAGRPFDLVLGSVHWLGTLGVDHPDFPAWDALPPERLWSEYLDELVAAARSGLFDVLAHPDLPKVFGHAMPRALDDRLEEAVAAIAQTGIAIECSSAGLRKPVGELYPAPSLLARLHAAGVPATLASDAHAPEDVARDYPTAVAALRQAGYETITRFSRREPTQVSLRWA